MLMETKALSEDNITFTCSARFKFKKLRHADHFDAAFFDII